MLWLFLAKRFTDWNSHTPFFIFIFIEQVSKLKRRPTSLTQTAKCDRPTRQAPMTVFWGFFDLLFCPLFLAWILFTMTSHFNSGGSPSTTNTNLTPSRVKWSNRKKRFLRCGLLTFCFSPLAQRASQIQQLKSTQSVLLRREERFSFLLTGSSMFQRWLTPIESDPKEEKWGNKSVLVKISARVCLIACLANGVQSTLDSKRGWGGKVVFLRWGICYEVVISTSVVLLFLDCSRGRVYIFMSECHICIQDAHTAFSHEGCTAREPEIDEKHVL